MSPIFVRPVREQLEHDRLIRHLGTKLKRKFEVGLNVGDEQVVPVKLGSGTFFPDIVLTDGRRTAGLIEVETAESVNNLEAMAQWVHFARSRALFSLYVPTAVYDVARRLCEANRARVGEIWVYRALPDGFDLIRMYSDSAKLAAASRAEAASKVAAKSRPKKAAKPKSKAVSVKAPKARPAPKAKKKARSKPSKATAKTKVTAAAKPAKAKSKAPGKVKVRVKAPVKAKGGAAAGRVSSLRRAAERAGRAKAPARKAPRKR